MMTTYPTPIPPTGLRAFFWRLPIGLFRLRLDFLLGERMLLLEHIGRKSGKVRQAVIEVARKDDETQTYYVCSGFGRTSQWYQNVKAQPEVTITVGRRKLPVMARLLSKEDSGNEMVRYATDHPRLARELTGILGYRGLESLDDYRALAEEQLPFVAFELRETDHAATG